ncbi:hypothetical protein LS71_008410 [Helicobacter jaachi]|uniref:Bacterial virulence protein VirB8 domain-containing protein n=2 Tax=Helicobacter jaachi TaxID=1677920 RepID=A0A4U8T788_9HELI|nr:hypothetical protein LS71_008410 [Helicobacter jaachi]
MNEAKHIKIDTIFQTIQDANVLLRTEQKTHEFVVNLNKGLIALAIVQLILIICLFPLKEKEPYLVGFSNATQNFVHIEKANEKITANQALVRSLISAYVLNRETINRFDDTERYEVVRLQSSQKVWQTFENIVAQEDSIYGNSNLERGVRIVNVAIIKDGYAQVEAQIGLFAVGVLQSQKRYRISLIYHFNELDIDFKSIPKNPTGFEVKEYSVTEIATIKELDEANKVNPDLVKSKIKKKEINKNDSNEFLRDDYQYKHKDTIEGDVPKDESDKETKIEFDFEKEAQKSPSQKRKELNDEIKKMRKEQEEKEKILAAQRKQQEALELEEQKERESKMKQQSQQQGERNEPNPFE